MRFLFLIFIFSTASFSAQKIEWRDNESLEWTDFKSNKNTSTKMDVAASTNCGWEIEAEFSTDLSQPIDFKIVTYFHQQKSWKDNSKINEYILNHEQKHFDIAEIYARKIRKKVAEKIKNAADYHKHFKVLYAQISKDYKDFQRKYDLETKHGMNEEKQQEFNLKIAQELEHLKSYKKS